MTKPNFAELKEKLTSFDKDAINKILIQIVDRDLKPVDVFTSASKIAINQHTKSSAIISELIEIISFQDNKISELLNYLHHNEDNLVGDDLIGDQRFTKRFNNYTKSTSDVLSETTTRLQKLRDGNNG